MYKGLAAAVITVLVLMIGFSDGALAGGMDGGGINDNDNGNGSDGDGLTTDRTRSDGNIIWEGLCVGASLNLSEASRKSCERQVRQAERKNAKNTRDRRKTDAHTKHKHDHKGRHKKQRDGERTAKATPPSAEPSEPVPQHIQYAALGDSVAAGLGLPELSDTTGQNCGRSFEAYPFVAAGTFGLPATNLACSGATMGDLITEQGVSGPNIPPQLDTAFAGGTPNLITITAGANDVRWPSFLRKCFTGTCGTASDQRIVDGLFAVLQLKTHTALQEIQRRGSDAPPKVIMTGYYNPLSAQCAEQEPRLTTEEIAWLSAQTATLNQTLQAASTQYSFVRFAPIDFTGHDICSSDPWVQTLDDPAPFHPTAAGQQAIAQQIH